MAEMTEESMVWKLRSRLSSEDGQGLVEYTMILVFVSIVSVAVLKTLGGDVVSLLTSIAADL
jgi:Flp pilus assembly pilin Flp